MAGVVKTDVQHDPVVPANVKIIARRCPHDDAYGRSCVEYDSHYGYIAVCPFWYGTELYRGRGLANVRSKANLAAFLGNDRPEDQSEYQTLCLKAASAGTEPGARLRM